MTPDHFDTVREALDSLYHFTPRSPDEVSIGRSQKHSDALAALAEIEGRLREAERKHSEQITRNRELHKLGAQQRDAMEARAEKAEAERDALLQECRTLRFKADPVPWRDRAEAAEQRVAELEAALREIIEVPYVDHDAGLRMSAIARRALGRE